MHNDDAQRNGSGNKQDNNVIEFSSRRNRELKDWQFTLNVYHKPADDSYEFNITQPEGDELDDFTIADILARAAFKVSPHDHEVAPDLELELGNDGWVEDGEEYDA